MFLIKCIYKIMKKNYLYTVLTGTCACAMLLYVISEDKTKFNTINRTFSKDFEKSVKQPKTDENDYVIYHKNHTALSGADIRSIKLKFLPQFKNPCWVEEYTSENVYENNALIHTKILTNQNSFKKFPTKLSRFKKDIGITIDPKGVPVTLNFGPCNQKNKCRLRCLPYFMLLGVAKSGTTDIARRIQNHPDILSGWTKEIYWWSQYRFSVPATLGDYSDMFAKSTADLLIHEYYNRNGSESTRVSEPIMGEFTSMTFFDFAHWRKDEGNRHKDQPDFTTPNDINAVLPNLKMIVILRNPTDRLYSSYNMFHRHDGSPEDFHMRVLGSVWWWYTCMKKHPIRNCAYGSPPNVPPVYDLLGDRTMWWHKQRNYTGEIRHGMYGLIITDWLSILPRENFLFLRTEDYSKNEAHTFNEEIFPFLGVHKLRPESEQFKRLQQQEIPHKESYSYLPMLNKTRATLNSFYKPFNEALAKILNDDKWLWKENK